jgi:hypothetical protein
MVRRRRCRSLEDAEARCRRYAKGFFFISALSVANMIAVAAGSKFALSMGLLFTRLGVTQLARVLTSADDSLLV